MLWLTLDNLNALQITKWDFFVPLSLEIRPSNMMSFHSYIVHIYNYFLPEYQTTVDHAAGKC